MSPGTVNSINQSITAFRRLAIKLPRTHDSDKQAYFRAGLSSHLQVPRAHYLEFNSVHDLINFVQRLNAQQDAALPTVNPAAARISAMHRPLPPASTAEVAVTSAATAPHHDEGCHSPSEVRSPRSALALVDLLGAPTVPLGAPAVPFHAAAALDAISATGALLVSAIL